MSDKLNSPGLPVLQVQSLSNITFANLFSDPDHPLRVPRYAFGLPIVVYVLVCAIFRRHYVRYILEQFPYTTRKSFWRMTQSDAWYIQSNLAEYDFPFTFEKAMQFALFKTYGIPSISKLLVETGLLSESRTATKRYADTRVLIGDFLSYHPKSPRATEALSRMNFIHSMYIKSGKISGNDMLYTLSLFALEPGRWIDRWEWRTLEPFERAAMGTLWKGIGDAMGISYDKLKSGGPDGAGWVDGLQWQEELEEWSRAYEKEHMLPHEDNFKTAEKTTAILLWGVPSWGQPFGKKIVCTLMDDRLRTAMM